MHDYNTWPYSGKVKMEKMKKKKGKNMEFKSIFSAGHRASLN